MPAADYDNIASEPHMLRVGKFNPTTGDHECTFDDPRSTVLGKVNIDLMTDGMHGIDPESLVGKLIEVEYAYPWSYLAVGAKIVPDGGRL